MIKIEIGFDSLKSIKESLEFKDSYRLNSSSDIIKYVSDYFFKKTGEELVLVPYNSIIEPSQFKLFPFPHQKQISYSNDSRGAMTLNEMIRNFKDLEDKGYSIDLAMNNSFNEYFDFNSDNFKFLKLLNESNKNGLSNEVTIASRTLFDFIKENYPNLKTISSTKFSFTKNGEYMDIDERIKNFDYMVLDNPFKNDKVFDRFKDDVGKLVFFLNYPCNYKIEECANHHYEIETGKSASISNYNAEEFSLTKAGKQCTKYLKNEWGNLYDKEIEKSKMPYLLEKGVRNFKISRSFPISIKGIDKIAENVIYAKQFQLNL